MNAVFGFCSEARQAFKQAENVPSFIFDFKHVLFFVKWDEVLHSQKINKQQLLLKGFHLGPESPSLFSGSLCIVLLSLQV